MAKQTQDDVRPIPKPFHYDGPDYQGFVFTLATGSGKPNHTLTITTQKREVFLAPAITGTWEGAGDGAPKSVTGAITGISGDGIDCSWSTPNGKNVLLGTLTYSNVGKLGQLENSAYLDGNVTAYDADGNVLPGMGPGHVYGEGYGPTTVGNAP
jgi:hypothetical protein